MTNLIPTPRTDKNGNVVVRHMKPVIASTSTASIPAPVVTHDDAAKPSLRMGAYQVLVNIVFNGEVTDEEQLFLENGLHNLSSETLNKFIDWDDDINYARLWTVADDMRNGVEPHLITDFVHLADMLEYQGIDETLFSDYVRGFNLCRGLHPINEDGTYPSQRFDQCHALTDVLTIMVDLIDNGVFEDDKCMTHPEQLIKWTPFIRDEKLRDLLLHSDRDAALKIIHERRILDADHIQQILEQEGKALADGAL